MVSVCFEKCVPSVRKSKSFFQKLAAGDENQKNQKATPEVPCELWKHLYCKDWIYLLRRDIFEIKLSRKRFIALYWILVCCVNEMRESLPNHKTKTACRNRWSTPPQQFCREETFTTLSSTSLQSGTSWLVAISHANLCSCGASSAELSRRILRHVCRYLHSKWNCNVNLWAIYGGNGYEHIAKYMSIRLWT